MNFSLEMLLDQRLFISGQQKPQKQGTFTQYERVCLRLSTECHKLVPLLILSSDSVEHYSKRNMIIRI